VWDNLKVYEANTHVGHAVNAGMNKFHRQVLHINPDFVLLQEVSPRGYQKIVNRFPRWWVVAVPGKHYAGREPHQTVILAKKSRFNLIDSNNRLISPWIGGGKHGRLHPNRNLTVGRFKDKVSGRVIVAFSVHTWAGLTTKRARQGHNHQIDVVANSISWRSWNRVVIAGGDWNEDLNRPRTHAILRMAKVGAVPTSQVLHHPAQSTSHKGRSRLDDLFFRKRPFIEAVSQWRKWIAGGSDHWGVVTHLRIKHL